MKTILKNAMQSAEPSNREVTFAHAENLVRALADLGYVIVPTKPTEDMLRAGFHANVGPRSTAPPYIYRAMVKAASE